jgi:membrane protein DedA with SNARE-associated domain
MRFLLPPERQEKVNAFFASHGSKAVFFARFFAGVRIGIYAFAGCQRMAWHRFLLLDLAGALISGPTSVWIGMKAARAFANNPEEAAAKASQLAHQFAGWLMAVVGVVIVGLVLWNRKKQASSQNPAQ